MFEETSSFSDNQQMPKVLQLYLVISQYPVLSRKIRQRMREELFGRGIVSEDDFEREVHQKAIESQKREGLSDPLFQESAADWDKRVRYIRAHLTDFYFAYNLPYELFEQILADTLHQREPDREVRLTFNPEIAPWDLLFSEGERYERLPPDERAKVQHHLREIIVVLIKGMISDHLAFVRLAKEVFTIEDLKDIRARRIGRGKIGGKAAGMLLAWKLLQHAGASTGLDPDRITIPDSYYVGSDVFYEVHGYNDFHGIMNQKYKSREEIVSDYPMIYERYRRADLPPHIAEELRALMEHIGPTPLIFRSSSLLEDSFATSFAGKYDSFFLPNSGSPEENFRAAKDVILKIYASTLSPDALIYRQRMGLVDFDERMAILIQKVEGQRRGRYYFPMIAGVGFSRNPFRWSAKIRREDGLLRLVCGLGTRAVDRADNDYARMIALSHPHLRPETRIEQLRHYSQHLIDVLNLKENTLETLPIGSVIGADFSALRLVAALDDGQHLQPFISRPGSVDPSRLVFTFDGLARDAAFTGTMRSLLTFLETRYEHPVDIEFAIEVTQSWPRPEYRISLLQCRPLSEHRTGATFHVPTDVPAHDVLFSARQQIPQGLVERVRYIVYVDPLAYHEIPGVERRLQVGRAVGRINERLHGEQFVLIGPGRWGTSDINLGVKVSYADIYNSRALIEVAHSNSNAAPEMAYGTHFFQDLVEAQIFPLALFPDDPGVIYNWDFFDSAQNVLPDLLPDDADLCDVIRVIDVPAEADGRHLEIVLDGENDEGLGYLRMY
ncbi:MAG: PEP/pyruvate-binding domain-containing protein [Chloroflexota bacterium]